MPRGSVCWIVPVLGLLAASAHLAGCERWCPTSRSTTPKTAAVAFSTLETIGPDRFDVNRAADYRLELPTAELKPGTYRLTCEARMAGTPAVSQDVRFTVTRAPR